MRENNFQWIKLENPNDEDDNVLIIDESSPKEFVVDEIGISQITGNRDFYKIFIVIYK